jgi:hypothetical protein
MRERTCAKNPVFFISAYFGDSPWSIDVNCSRVNATVVFASSESKFIMSRPRISFRRAMLSVMARGFSSVGRATRTLTLTCSSPPVDERDRRSAISIPKLASMAVRISNFFSSAFSSADGPNSVPVAPNSFVAMLRALRSGAITSSSTAKAPAGGIRPRSKAIDGSTTSAARSLTWQATRTSSSSKMFVTVTSIAISL